MACRELLERHALKRPLSPFFCLQSRQSATGQYSTFRTVFKMSAADRHVGVILGIGDLRRVVCFFRPRRSDRAYRFSSRQGTYFERWLHNGRICRKRAARFRQTAFGPARSGRGAVACANVCHARCRDPGTQPAWISGMGADCANVRQPRHKAAAHLSGANGGAGPDAARRRTGGAPCPCR